MQLDLYYEVVVSEHDSKSERDVKPALILKLFGATSSEPVLRTVPYNWDYAK